jgi:hypothetical protein
MSRHVFVLACLAAGVLYIAIPHILLPVCDYAGVSAGAHAPASMQQRHDAPPGHAGQVHAACFRTAGAELGIAGLIVFGCLLLAFTKSVERRLGITLMLAGTTVVGALIPTVLIGVCEQETMPCRAGTLPGLLLLSGLFFLCTVLNARHLVACRAVQNNG